MARIVIEIEDRGDMIIVDTQDDTPFVPGDLSAAQVLGLAVLRTIQGVVEISGDDGTGLHRQILYRRVDDPRWVPARGLLPATLPCDRCRALVLADSLTLVNQYWRLCEGCCRKGP